jgi:hypothetical protein
MADAPQAFRKAHNRVNKDPNADQLHDPVLVLARNTSLYPSLNQLE